MIGQSRSTTWSETKLGNLVQLINFGTWSRVVGQSLRSSIIDHVYVNDVTLINNISHIKPCFGDHVLILVELCIIRPKPLTIIKRDWRQHTKEKLNLSFSRVDWSNNAQEVQDIWNDFECKLIDIVYSLVPLSYSKGNFFIEKPPAIIKNKLNTRNRLIKNLKKRPSQELKKRISNLNCEIRVYFHTIKKRSNS